MRALWFDISEDILGSRNYSMCRIFILSVECILISLGQEQGIVAHFTPQENLEKLSSFVSENRGKNCMYGEIGEGIPAIVNEQCARDLA